MNFTYLDNIRAAQGIGKQFVQEKLLAEDPKKGQTKRELVEEIGKSEFYGCLTPEDYGWYAYGIFGCSG